MGPGDAEALLRIYSAESTRYLGREPMDADEAHHCLRDIVAAAELVPRTLYALGLAVDGDLLGVVKLHRDRPVAAVSYILRADAWGRGYATAGVREILALAFGPLALPKVRAKHHPGNSASGRVLLKAGFVPTGEHNGFITYAIRRRRQPRKLALHDDLRQPGALAPPPDDLRVALPGDEPAEGELIPEGQAGRRIFVVRRPFGLGGGADIYVRAAGP
nr:GNAT family N-acetyltransferase [Streptomyces sp. CBMA156]